MLLVFCRYHICSIMVSVSVILFEAGASDFISHTIDFVSHTIDLTHLLHVQRHPGCLRESELEAQVLINSNLCRLCT